MSDLYTQNWVALCDIIWCCHTYKRVSGNYSTNTDFMTRKLIIIFTFILIYGCHNADINDSNKRNENGPVTVPCDQKYVKDLSAN